MKYTGVGGVTKVFKHKTRLCRSINIGIANPGTWVEDKLLLVIWRSTLGACEEVTLKHVYRDPSTGLMWRNYDLVFMVFRETSRNEVNALVWNIEQAIIKELGVEMKSSHENGV